MINNYQNNYPSISKTAQYRKVTKPLLERKRRARINKCLDELKDLMVGALEAEGENISKMEKADILELTVHHLQRIHKRRDTIQDAKRFHAGFGQCAAETYQFLLSIPNVDHKVCQNLMNHLRALLGEQAPLSVDVPKPTKHVYSPPLSPAPITQRNENGCLTPSVNDLNKPMAGLLMEIPDSGGKNTKHVLRNVILERNRNGFQPENEKSMWRPW